MMLCIADAVIEDKGVDFHNIARHFKNWADGIPVGIGANTFKVLMKGDYVEHPFEVSHKVWKMSKCQSAANREYLSAHSLRSKMCRLMRNSV